MPQGKLQSSKFSNDNTVLEMPLLNKAPTISYTYLYSYTYIQLHI